MYNKFYQAFKGQTSGVTSHIHPHPLSNNMICYSIIQQLFNRKRTIGCINWDTDENIHQNQQNTNSKDYVCTCMYTYLCLSIHLPNHTHRHTYTQKHIYVYDWKIYYPIFIKLINRPNKLIEFIIQRKLSTIKVEVRNPCSDRIVPFLFFSGVTQTYLCKTA